MEKIKKAEAGDYYLIKYCEDPFHSELPKEHWKEGMVGTSCGQNSPLGQWACITHNVVFGNQMNKDCHIDGSGRRDGSKRGTIHTLAWWCPNCCKYETP